MTLTSASVRVADVEAAWPLTGVEVGESLPSHPSRAVLRVHSDQGEFVAKVSTVPPTDLAEVDPLFVLEYLRARGFAHAPSLLQTRSGHLVARIGGNAISMMEFIPQEAHGGVATSDTWAQLGLVAARLNAFGDYPIPFAIPLSAALGQLAARVKGLPIEVRFLELLARAAELEQMPSDALVHGGINQANARRHANRTIVLVDWDQAGRAPAALEYGYPVITVFLAQDDHAFDDRAACAFFASYVDEGGVIDARQMFNAALFHALRYMWWGETERRWARILYAASREVEICSALP